VQRGLPREVVMKASFTGLAFALALAGCTPSSTTLSRPAPETAARDASLTTKEAAVLAELLRESETTIARPDVRSASIR